MFRTRFTGRVVAELLAGWIHREPGRPLLAAVVGGAEEERLVLDDRAADAAAALLVLELRDRASSAPLPTQSWLRPKKNAVPRKRFVPLLVMALMPPPENPP